MKQETIRPSNVGSAAVVPPEAMDKLREFGLPRRLDKEVSYSSCYHMCPTRLGSQTRRGLLGVGIGVDRPDFARARGQRRPG